MPSAPTYEPVPYWGRIPHGMTLGCEATSVAVGPDDRVYVFNRGSHPLLVFDADGNLLEAWSDPKLFGRPHGIRVTDDSTLLLADDKDHVVEHRTPAGELIFSLGEKGNPHPKQGLGDGKLFNRPTDIAVHRPTGDLFVTDGYGNSRVHRFTGEGEHILSWGDLGTYPGQFALPHGIAITPDDRVLVVDRENFRIQAFTLEGEFIELWWVHRPFCIDIGRGPEPLLYVGEAGSAIKNRKGLPRLGNRISVRALDGTEVAHFGADLPGLGPDQFTGIHSVAVDSRGDVYIAEGSNSFVADHDGPPPRGEWPTLRKWRLVPD